jgi:MarR family transcriptional regulator, organic hydroperoxide resistance regulator
MIQLVNLDRSIVAVPQNDQLGARQPAGASIPADARQPAGASTAAGASQPGGTCEAPSISPEGWEVADCFFELIGSIIGHAEQIAQRMCIPSPFVKALHMLERPMAMKELGKRMHCDPSFVTLIADMLEKRGLARREAHAADRRVKNLVLTDDGLALKHRVEAEIVAWMPWNRALDDAERVQLLALIRKMLNAEKALPDDGQADDAGDGAAASGAKTADTAGSLADLLLPGLHEHASPRH